MSSETVKYKKILFALLAALIFIINTSYAAEKRTVTGLDGVRIEIPSYPERIACFYHPAYDKIVMLDNGKRIAMMPRDANQWAYKFYPELKGIPIDKSGNIPDVERLLSLKVDLVFYPKGRRNVEKVVEAGIPAICPFDNNVVPANVDEYMAEFKRQIRFFGEILGADAETRAERYCAFMDEINSRVKAITADIPESAKPRVYYGKATDLYSTQGYNSVMRWYTEIAGGIYLPKELQNYYVEVNRELIIGWNPDIILLGMYGASDTGKENTGLKSLKAYSSGKVYVIPAGVFHWDMSSCETALLPLYLGKKFHPGLFKEWDIIKEMKRFYSEIYEIEITDEDAERMLNGMPPL